MKSVRALLGPLSSLADIKPPGRSFEDCERFLEAARAAGVGALVTDETGIPRAEFGTPLGMGLLRLYRWMRDSRENGLTYEEAKRSWAAAFEREHAAVEASMHQQDSRRAKALAEREGPRSRQKYGLGPEMHGFADDAGL